MKKKESKFDKLTQKYPVVHMTATLLLLTAVVAFTLGFIYDRTAPIIKEIQDKALYDAISLVIPGGDTAEELEGFEWPKTVERVLTVYDSGGGLLGYAVETTPNGFGGAIRVLTGVSPGGTVVGVTILDMKETPNLGTKVRAEDFLDRFAGRESGMTMGRNPDEVQAISGATVSSKAVFEGVKSAIAAVLQISTGGGDNE